MSTWWILAWLQLATTLMMTGIIWSVQLVQYPLLARVGATEFIAYHRDHMRRIGWVVMPLMLAELSTAFLMAILRPSATTFVGVGLLAGIWASTFMIQVPLHGRLRGGADPGTLRWLVQTNWVRTVLWTARAVVAIRLVMHSG
jgi:hypothetical protein